MSLKSLEVKVLENILCFMSTLSQKTLLLDRALNDSGIFGFEKTYVYSTIFLVSYKIIAVINHVGKETMNSVYSPSIESTNIFPSCFSINS
jgi:hypothetical protein